MVFTKKVCRFETPCSPQTFKGLLACATQHHPVLSAEKIAEECEIPVSWLYLYANENQQRDIPAVKLRRVVEVTGRIDLFRFLLAPIGHTTVPLGSAGTSERLVEEVLDVQDASGDLAKTVRHAMKDGVFTEQEMADAERSAIRVQNEAAEVVAAIRAQRPALARVIGGIR